MNTELTVELERPGGGAGEVDARRGGAAVEGEGRLLGAGQYLYSAHGNTLGLRGLPVNTKINQPDSFTPAEPSQPHKQLTGQHKLLTHVVVHGLCVGEGAGPGDGGGGPGPPYHALQPAGPPQLQRSLPGWCGNVDRVRRQQHLQQR